MRLFHWTLVAAFFGAFAFEDPRRLHETLGYVAIAAVAVRLVGASSARGTPASPPR